MEKYKVDKQGKLKIRDKKKILKILRLIYDICSAIFILFVCVGLIISSSPRDDHNDLANQHIPNIQEKVRRNMTHDSGTGYYTFDNDDFMNINLFNDILGVIGTGGVSYNGAGSATLKVSYGQGGSNPYLTYTIAYISGFANSSYKQIMFRSTSGSYAGSMTWQVSSQTSFTKLFYFAQSGENSVQTQKQIVSFKWAPTSTALKDVLDDYVDVYYTQQDIDEAFDEGYEQGEIHGMDIAADPSSEIYQTTYGIGYDDGYDEGYEEGYSAAESNQAPVDSQLIISSDYDFRGLITQEIDSATGLMRVSQSSGGLTDITYLDLKGLTFKVEDNVYNEVRLAYMSLDSANTIYDSVNMKYSTMQNYFGNDYVYYRGLVGVYYRYVENGTITKQVQVFDGYSIEYKDENGTIINGFNYTTPKWSNGVFRTIIIVSDNGQKQTTPSFSNSFTTYELLKLNGSQLIHIDNNVFNVFSLLTQAFNSVGGILSIAIIPGISIGLLMFIPLIVTIILFIIHMIKK